jgi:MFS family permease
MALTQGIFSRMIADAAPDHQRATSFGAFFFASGVSALLASLGAGLLWDRGGPADTFITAAGVAALAGAMAWLMPRANVSP